jgi:hypothetical protein
MEKTTAAGRGDLLKSKNVARAEGRFRVPVAGMPETAQRPEPEPQADPAVELHRGPDGTVAAITVRCSCGEEITLQCEYLGEGEADEV